MNYCPECSEPISPNATSCERCDRFHQWAAVELCSACRFGNEPCVCGDSPDYDWNNEDDLDDDDSWDDEPDDDFEGESWI